MSDFILEYDILESIAKHSNSLGKRAEEYKESLENRMLSGIGNITGPSSRYLLNASDSISDKINDLKQKSETFYNFAKQISNLLKVAEQIDQEVADAISAQREYLLEHHESLRIQNFKVRLLELLVEVENLIPLLSIIAASLRELEVKQESLEDVIKNWYKKQGNVLSNIVKAETTAWTLFCRKVDGLDFSYLKNIKWNDKVDYKARIKQLYDKPIRQNAKRHYRMFTEYEWDLFNVKNAKNPIDAAIHMEKYFWDRWPGLFGHYMTRSALNSGIDPEWAKIAGDFSSGILLEGFMTITVNGVRAYKNLRTGEIVYGDTVLGSGIGSTTKGTKNGSGAIEQTGANAVKRTGTVTKPSELPDSNVRPKGNYAPNDTPGYIRQNESADLLSQNGYRVEMLDEVPGGNGYGIKETSNQDLLVESKVYDSYAPKAETSIKTIIRELSGKTKNQATNIILNLDDFVGDVDELITSIIQKATPSGDLKRLEDLKIIKDGKIINIFID
jgi:hypothetical protein